MKDLWEEICSLYRWIVRFITEDIWRLELDDLGRAKRKFLKYLKIAIMTVRESGINKLGLYSVSLSFFVAMSVVPFAAVAIGAGAPPMMVAICFAIFSNTMWGITEYAGGPGPIYFGQGYFERPRFYKINFILVTLSVLITFSVGMGWWKIIGLY